MQRINESPPVLVTVEGRKGVVDWWPARTLNHARRVAKRVAREYPSSTIRICPPDGCPVTIQLES